MTPRAPQGLGRQRNCLTQAYLQGSQRVSTDVESTVVSHVEPQPLAQGDEWLHLQQTGKSF